MDPNLTIDPGNARRLLKILELATEAGKGEIDWALGIIHQIPGYGKITIAKASQDRVLREVLIGISREEIAPTVPRDMEALLRKAEEREKLKAAAKEKGGKETREFVEAAKKAAMATPKEAPSAPPIAGPAPAPAGAPTAAAPSAGGTAGFSIIIGKPPKVAAPVSLEKGIRKGIATAAFLPFGLAASMGAQVVAKADPEKGAAVALLAKRVGPLEFDRIKTQFLLYAPLEQFNSFAAALANVPTSPFVRRASSFDTYGGLVDFISTGRVASIVPGQVPGGIFLTPSRDGISLVYTPSAVSGLLAQATQGLLGRAAARALGALIGGGAKAAVGVAAEAAGAAAGGAAGAGIGGGLGALFGGVGAIPGAIVGWLASKIPNLLSWLKIHAKDFGVAAFALIVGGVFLNNIFLVGLGGGVGAVSLAAGGTGAIGQGATGFLQGLYVGLTALVLPSLAVPLIVAFATIPVLIAFIYYVITAGAFVAPKQVGGGPSFNLPFSLTGPLPSGLPFGWPVRSPVIQGPNTTYTHAGAQAIDIIDPTGTPVKATAPGVAAVYDFGPFGKHVEIQGMAEGLSFTVRYAHLSVVLVDSGQAVTAEQTIGLVGNTGNSDTPHLHYEFKGLPMSPPFIPKAVPEGCLGIESCNVTTD